MKLLFVSCQKNPARIFVLLLALPLLLCLSEPAAHAASFAPPGKEQTVDVRLLSPIVFGKLTSAGGGSVQVDPRSGACTAKGGAVIIRPSCAHGVVEIRGNPGDRIMVNLPGEAPLNGGAQGGATLRDFTMDRENPIMLGPDGRARIGVGATLSSSQTLQRGDYNGQFEIQAVVLK